MKKQEISHEERSKELNNASGHVPHVHLLLFSLYLHTQENIGLEKG